VNLTEGKVNKEGPKARKNRNRNRYKDGWKIYPGLKK